MKYPVVLHKEINSCFGVSVPDIQGCFSAGDTKDKALHNVKLAIHDHLEILADDGKPAPIGLTIGDYLNDHDYDGGIWAYIDIDIENF